ncbi:serine/threonine protein kinase [Leptolyngbya sp. FACHB-8]|uniref:serine/threonine protein kinase n=1 Tax=unclassified Leptolyngbya TaxID=2650499 RepID=UPI001683148C|nr:serine/threonine protein kinase [Leptolyngbya sp. FACHB-8]MBD1909370.1 serine/threonine protein kinase [Leptolyngbya sp. FACHB-8]
MSLDSLVQRVEAQLLPHVHIESVDPNDPVVVRKVPFPWRALGMGNYAAVFWHPEFPDYVIKVYAPGRPGLTEEAEVYRRLGTHPAFSECFYRGSNCLILKRLEGITLYDCLSLGIRIPKQVIKDIDQALDYAQSRGLNGHDVHGRNVMMYEGRGLVVDVSDFLNQEPCSAWDDLKWAYYRFYLPILAPMRLKVPHTVLNMVRKTYRFFRRLLPYRKCDRKAP